MEQITLSEKTERGLILSQLNENSAMIIDMHDIAALCGCEYDKVQKDITKRSDFPSNVSGINGKTLLFKSGDVIRWINRQARNKKN